MLLNEFILKDVLTEPEFPLPSTVATQLIFALSGFVGLRLEEYENAAITEPEVLLHAVVLVD